LEIEKPLYTVIPEISKPAASDKEIFSSSHGYQLTTETAKPVNEVDISKPPLGAVSSAKPATKEKDKSKYQVKF